MQYNPEIHHHRSIRLKGYDYSQEGMYFITINVQDRVRIFGEIVNGEMHLNELGKIAYNEWMHTPEIRKNVELGAFIVMPDHIHGIIIINDTDDSSKGVLYTPVSHTPVSHTHDDDRSDRDVSHMSDIDRGVSYTPDKDRSPDIDRGVCDTPQRPPLRSPSRTIGAIIRGYKSSVTRKINEMRNSNGFVVWQRNYWEHIIRDYRAFDAISDYITNNPKKWDVDKLK